MHTHIFGFFLLDMYKFRMRKSCPYINDLNVISFCSCFILCSFQRIGRMFFFVLLLFQTSNQNVNTSHNILKIVSIGPSNSASQYLFVKLEDMDTGSYVHSSVHCRIIYKSEDMKRTEGPIRWLNKECVLNFTPSLLKSWNFAICNNIEDAEWYYMKQNSVGGKRQVLGCVTYKWNRRIYMMIKLISREISGAWW